MTKTCYQRLEDDELTLLHESLKNGAKNHWKELIDKYGDMPFRIVSDIVRHEVAQAKIQYELKTRGIELL